jgi:multiple sugar transport system permease protein
MKYVPGEKKSGIEPMTSIKVHRKRTSSEKRDIRAFYGFISLLIIGWVVFLFGPLIYSFFLSFTRYDVLSAPEFIGVQNYIKLTTDERFIKALSNTFYYALFYVPISTILAMLLAMLLQQVRTGKSLFRSIFYLPAIVPLVPVTLLFTWMFNYKFGLVNTIFRFIGLTPLPWLTDANLMKPMLIVMAMWGFGASMLIFLAGLQSIPNEYYEASSLDGASAWQQFRHITLPLLSPTTLFVFISKLIGAFQVFTTAYLLTNGSGGPRDAVLFVVLYLYNQGFKLGNFGYASSMAWILAIIIIIFTLVSLRVTRRHVYYESSPEEVAS